jgi:hypothetical protein
MAPAPTGCRAEKRVKASFDHRRMDRFNRVANPLLVALIAFAFIWLSSQFDEQPSVWTPVFVVLFLQTVVVSEVVRAISRRLDQRWPWRTDARTRLVAHAAVIVLLAAGYIVVLYVPLKIWQQLHGSVDPISWEHLASAAVIGLTLAVSLSMLQMVVDFYTSWQDARGETERLRELGLKAQLEALKTQVNPHFLFNSLTALHGIIGEDAERARAFVIELADVFRYALTHGHRDLVPLSQELDFLDAFEALLVLRHGPGLTIRRTLPGGSDGVGLPPMTLQLLVENAVKHNRLGPDESLTIDIVRRDDVLEVSNPAQPRRHDSSGTGSGLRNIDARCRLLSARGIEVLRDGGRFLVKVPLLPCAP